MLLNKGDVTSVTAVGQQSTVKTAQKSTVNSKSTLTNVEKCHGTENCHWAGLHVRSKAENQHIKQSTTEKRWSRS